MLTIMWEGIRYFYRHDMTWRDFDFRSGNHIYGWVKVAGNVRRNFEPDVYLISYSEIRRFYIIVQCCGNEHSYI